jgi:hypothetical protein
MPTPVSASWRDPRPFEELDSIVYYDIKYRMGKDAGE